MYCKNCGSKINENNDYCDNCKTAIINNQKKSKIFLICGIIFLIITELLIIAPVLYWFNDISNLIFIILMLVFTLGLYGLTDDCASRLEHSYTYEYISLENPIYIAFIIFFAILSAVFFILYFKKKKQLK